MLSRGASQPSDSYSLGLPRRAESKFAGFVAILDITQGAPVLAAFENWEGQGRISIGVPFATKFQIWSISSSVTAMQP